MTTTTTGNTPARLLPVKAGDVVSAAHGGPKMTVEKVNADDEYADVLWHDEHQLLHKAKIHKNALRVVAGEPQHLPVNDPAAPYGRDASGEPNPNPRDPNRRQPGI